MKIFYRPSDGYVGDVIPFYWEGEYHAFFLKAPLPPDRHGADGTPYAHLVSNDLVNWRAFPMAIEPGPAGSPDAVSCFTGSVIEHNGTFHLFYTGYPGQGKPQTICRAVSNDLIHWEKDPTNPMISADTTWYETIDWRDPFPFWNDEAGEYWMLLAARTNDGPDNRRGCVALVTSPDLERWTVKPPFWSPHLYYTHECPDLFRWQDQWVLVYSTFSERNVTHFRVSDTLEGPWLAPTNDTFDGRAFYAAKTASDGNRRFVFGWNPTKIDERDDGRWEWGGRMVIHELNEDLTVRAVPELINLFDKNLALDFMPRIGDWTVKGTAYHVNADDRFAVATFGVMPETCCITGSVLCSDSTRACGILLRTDEALESYYQVRWEPGRQRVVFDRWQRPGDEPFIIERPLRDLEDRPLHFKILIEDSVVVAYINDAVALSCRAYASRAGQWGIFVSEGDASFRDVSISTTS